MSSKTKRNKVWCCQSCKEPDPILMWKGIKAAIELAGGQDVLAEKLGIKQPTLFKTVEKPKLYDLKTLPRIAKAVGLSEEELQVYAAGVTDIPKVCRVRDTKWPARWVCVACGRVPRSWVFNALMVGCLLKGITGTELGFRMGLTRQAISLWRTRQKPKWETLLKLADSLELTEYQLWMLREYDVKKGI